MKTTFLGQGFDAQTSNSIGSQLIQFLADNTFTDFTVISAFASVSAVNGLAQYIQAAKPNLNSIRFIVGVDQEGTSKEALQAILSLNINGYIFYQKESVIFHPKVYLIENANAAKLIVGSSNLTSRGLFANIEAAILLETETATDMQLIDQVKQSFSGLFTLNDPNLYKITQQIIDDFVNEGIVPNEIVTRIRQGKFPITNLQNAATLQIPTRSVSPTPAGFRGGANRTRIIRPILAAPMVVQQQITIQPNSLIWQKNNLPSSDAQQVKRGTAITGVLRLGTANFRIDGSLIDRNTYFRNEIFGGLNWSTVVRPQNTPLENATASFDITINGANIGTHQLRISHDAARIAGQENVPTTIHWGRNSPIINYLKANNVTGMTLQLFSPYANSNVYRITIS